jgi:hypothetical protein
MMLYSGLALGVLAFAPNVLGKEMAQNMQKAATLYDTGAMMGKIMARKEVSVQCGLAPAVMVLLFTSI